MPMYPPSLSEALTSLQRQIDQINTARPGPMSWGPDDGHIRFYAADGRVLFQVNSTGASVESRGALTGLTGLLDSIRATDDAQNGRLNDHHGWIEGLGTRMTGAEGRLDGHDGTLASHSTRITAAQSRADGAHTRLDGVDSTLGSHGTRLNSVESKNSSQDSTLGSHSTRITTAQSRADDAYSLASGKATVEQMNDLINALNARLNAIRIWFANAKQADPVLPDPPSIPGLPNVPS